VAFAFESLGKACAEFRGVTPGHALGPDFAAAEVIYSLATGKTSLPCRKPQDLHVRTEKKKNLVSVKGQQGF